MGFLAPKSYMEAYRERSVLLPMLAAKQFERVLQHRDPSPREVKRGLEVSRTRVAHLRSPPLPSPYSPAHLIQESTVPGRPPSAAHSPYSAPPRHCLDSNDLNAALLQQYLDIVSGSSSSSSRNMTLPTTPSLARLCSLPPEQLNSVFALVLVRAVAVNDKLPSKGPLTRWHAKVPSDIPVGQYLSR